MNYFNNNKLSAGISTKKSRGRSRGKKKKKAISSSRESITRDIKPICHNQHHWIKWRGHRVFNNLTNRDVSGNTVKIRGKLQKWHKDDGDILNEIKRKTKASKLDRAGFTSNSNNSIILWLIYLNSDIFYENRWAQLITSWFWVGAYVWMARACSTKVLSNI